MGRSRRASDRTTNVAWSPGRCGGLRDGRPFRREGEDRRPAEERAHPGAARDRQGEPRGPSRLLRRRPGRLEELERAGQLDGQAGRLELLQGLPLDSVGCAPGRPREDRSPRRRKRRPRRPRRGRRTPRARDRVSPRRRGCSGTRPTGRDAGRRDTRPASSAGAAGAPGQPRVAPTRRRQSHRPTRSPSTTRAARA